jgi:hypothetical protein
MTLAVLVLGPFSVVALAQHGNPRFPVNVTLGPVSPPPGASFTPKYPGEFKASPPPGLNVTVSPKVTAKPTAKVKHKIKPSASPLPSTVKRPLFDAAHVPTPVKKNTTSHPVVTTVSVKPSVHK